MRHILFGQKVCYCENLSAKLINTLIILSFVVSSIRLVEQFTGKIRLNYFENHSIEV